MVAAAAARLGSIAEFGGFSLALTVYILLLWVARSLVDEPFMVRLTAASDEDQARAGRDAVGVAIALGAIGGALMVAVGVWAGTRWAPVVALMGLFMPALLAQDAYRYILLAADRPRSASANAPPLRLWSVGDRRGSVRHPLRVRGGSGSTGAWAGRSWWNSWPSAVYRGSLCWGSLRSAASGPSGNCVPPCCC
jgi:hypothetical protein